jgi:hypothetical protein
MKHIALALTAVLAAVSSYAQGTVNFQTKSGTAVDAPVRYGGQLAGSAYMGQLYAQIGVGLPFAAIGTPLPFRSDAGIGYITAGGAVPVPGAGGGTAASIKLVAWASSLGATYEEVVAKGLGGFNESAPIAIANLGGGGTPPSPAANLIGLQGFEIATIVPEPAIAALGLLGAGLLLIRRRK